MQHPPERLLAYIASDEEALGATRRIWAMERAAELRVDPGALRAAVLAHDEKLRQALRAGTFPGKRDRPPAPLGLIKDTAVRLGILTQADWPDVPKLTISEISVCP